MRKLRHQVPKEITQGQGLASDSELNRLGNFHCLYLDLLAAVPVDCSVPGSSNLQGDGSNCYLSLHENPRAILGIRRQKKKEEL